MSESGGWQTRCSHLISPFLLQVLPPQLLQKLRLPSNFPKDYNFASHFGAAGRGKGASRYDIHKIFGIFWPPPALVRIWKWFILKLHATFLTTFASPWPPPPCNPMRTSYLESPESQWGTALSIYRFPGSNLMAWLVNSPKIDPTTATFAFRSGYVTAVWRGTYHTTP